MARPSHRGRGGTLIATLIVVAGLTLLAVAALNMATTGTIGAAQKTHADQLALCANAAAQRIMGEYALAGVPVASITTAQIPGGPKLGFGHFDSGMTVSLAAGARRLPKDAGGMLRPDDNETSTMRAGSDRGPPSNFFSHCTDAQGRQYEVELFVRLGIR